VVVTSQQQHQQQRRRSQRSSTRRKQTGNGNQLAVIDAVADIHFADDFAEYLARAESGGSTYGVLRRRAFAQSSLRIRRRPANGDNNNDDDDVNNTRLAVSRQRRSRSLVPPPRRRSGEQDPSLPNHKTLLQALCAQTQQQQQQQQQQQTKHSDKLQVNIQPNSAHNGKYRISEGRVEEGEGEGGRRWEGRLTVPISASGEPMSTAVARCRNYVTCFFKS